MKNCLLFFPACLLGFTAVAQPEKGQYLLNLAGSYDFVRSDYYNRQYGFTTHLGAGYFLTNRLAVGVQAETERHLHEYKQPTNNIQYVLGTRHQTNRLGIMARYYLPTGKKTALFLHGNAGFQNQFARYEFVDYTKSEKAEKRINYPDEIFATITPGFAWFPTKRVAVEFSALTFGYRQPLSNTHNARYTRKFGFPDGLNPKLGVTILLGGNKKTPSVPE